MRQLRNSNINRIGNARGYDEYQHSPSLWTQRSHNIQVVPKFLKLDASEGLGENISCHALCWDVDQVDISGSDSLTDEVEVDVDVFGAAVEGRVLR